MKQHQHHPIGDARIHSVAERQPLATLTTLIIIGLAAMMPCRAAAQLTGPGSKPTTDSLAQDDLNREVLRLIADNYYRDVTPDSTLTAVQLADSLDPFSSYMSAEDNKAFRASMANEDFRYGITFDTMDGRFIVVEIASGSVAEERGLALGDEVISINGTELHDSWETLDKVLRPGIDWADFTIRCAASGAMKTLTLGRTWCHHSNVPTVMMVDSTIGYVRVLQFSQGIAGEVRHAIEYLTDHQLSGLILDLRGNPGGIVTEATALANLFVHRTDTVLRMSGRFARYGSAYTLPDEAPFAWLPLAVLVDQQSCSASELFAGVMQDLGRALIVGEPTVGKGLVMNIIRISNGDALYLATAQFTLPSGRCDQRAYKGRKILGDHQRDFASQDNFAHQLDCAIDEGACDTFVTAAGTTVFAAEGIVPDVIVRPRYLSKEVYTAVERGAYQALRDHSEWLMTVRLDEYLSCPLPEAITTKALQFVFEHDTTAGHLIAAEYAMSMPLRIRAEIAWDAWGWRGFDHVLTRESATIRRTVQLLHAGAADPGKHIAIVTH